MELGPNVVIAGRFRLNRLLGKGGMGSVWHATHLGLDVPCAVKFIEGEFASLPEAQLRFEREAKAAAALRSPHVVQIMDHGVFDNVPYIAMELLEGEDLGRRLNRVGRMPLQELATVITQVCRALTKAHSGGVVHRDLKPDNIYLVRDDDREVAKVLDFGIAKANSVTGGLEGSNTKTGAMLGTPYYMSPEQAQGTKSVDYRSDLWSLAVIVFQAVTGKLPFDSEALGDLLVKIIVMPIPIPSEVTADVPPGFDQWWAKASNRDPQQRFQTAKEFGDSLAPILGAAPMTAGGSGSFDSSGARITTPNGYGPGATPFPPGQAPFIQTPQPMGGPGTPRPEGSGPHAVPVFQQTPQPGAGGYPQVQIAELGGANAPVPAGTAHALGVSQMSESVRIPKSNTGSKLGIGIAAVAVVAAVAFGGIMMVSSKSGDPPASATGAQPPAESKGAGAADTKPATAPIARDPGPTPPVVVVPPPAETPTPSESAQPVRAQAPVQPTHAASVAQGAHLPAQPPAAAKPPAPAPAKPSAQKPADLGF